MSAIVAETSCAVQIDRKKFLKALNRGRRVVTRRTLKPILQCVHLEAANGVLRISATDLEVFVTNTLEVQGELPTCIVPLHELLQRVKTGKADECMLQPGHDSQTLRINGGRVEHSIETVDPAEYPPVPAQADGMGLVLAGKPFRDALAVVSIAMAREPSRYAIDGVLLESDRTGARVVATDGRRIVMVELGAKRRGFHGQVILPKKFVTLLGRLIGGRDDRVRLLVDRPAETEGDPAPAKLITAGRDWTASCEEPDGRFPVYRDVIPESHSKFVTDRRALLETVSEVAASTSEDNQAVRLDLVADSVRVSAMSPGVGESAGVVPASFLGGGPDQGTLALNPAFLLDALKTIPDAQVVLDVEPTVSPKSGQAICFRASLIHGHSQPDVRWVVMPLAIE